MIIYRKFKNQINETISENFQLFSTCSTYFRCSTGPGKVGTSCHIHFGKITTKLRDHIYSERIIDAAKFGTPYQIRCDVKSVISDTLMKQVIRNGEKTEELFGFPPSTFLKEIHFVYNEEKSFFTSEKPSYVFVTTVPRKRSDYYESEEDYILSGRMLREEHVRHEVCHLLDYYLKFSEDETVLSFMKKIRGTQIEKDLFKLIYLSLPEASCFDSEVMDKYLRSHEDISSISSSVRTEVAFGGDELFAEVIATLNSRYWEKTVQEQKGKSIKVVRLYQEALGAFKTSIQQRLSLSGYPTDVPIVALMDKRIKQLTETLKS